MPTSHSWFVGEIVTSGGRACGGALFQHRYSALLACPPRASPLPVIDRTSAHPAGNLRITSPFRRARKGDYGRNWEAIAAPGPVVPTLGAAQVGSYLGNTGCDGNGVATAWPLTLAVKTHFGDSRRE